MARNSLLAARPATARTVVSAGVPPAPAVGGARTFAEMEALALRHAGIRAAEATAFPAQPPEVQEQEASKDE